MINTKGKTLSILSLLLVAITDEDIYQNVSVVPTVYIILVSESTNGSNTYRIIRELTRSTAAPLCR